MNLSFLAALAMGLALPLTASAAPAPAPASCKYVEIAKLPLNYTGPSLEITTTGSINGTPSVMLLDTGAWRTLLTRTGTERLGLRLRNTGHHAYGVGGIARLYETRVNEFVTGPSRASKGVMTVLTDFGYVPSYDAIVGAPFLLQADLEISLAAKELKFFRPLDCRDEFLAYWDPKAVELPFHRDSREGSNPLFTVSVNGRELIAMIDTGAGTTSITLDAAKRTGLQLDAPGVNRLSDAVGVGTRKRARWRTRFATLQVGDETIRNAEVNVIDSDVPTDVILGADFLRSHRVLFAMSQRKLYFSYIGGVPLDEYGKLAPWIVAEAEAGNADAQMALADIYAKGKIVTKDTALADSWLAKAASGGNPQANIRTGRWKMTHGQLAEGAAHLRTGLDRLPSHHQAALWLHIARLRLGQPELAASELQASVARYDDEWPRPVADFYLGKLSAAALLEEAAEDKTTARARTCQAIAAMGEWHGARGEKEQERPLAARYKAECAVKPTDPAIAQAQEEPA